MLAALALLLVALILVLRKDRNFWFPPERASQSGSEPLEEAQSEEATTMHPAVPAQPKLKLPTSEEGRGKGTKPSRRIRTRGDEPNRGPSAGSRGDGAESAQ